MAGVRGVKDYTCGFRGYRVKLLRDALNYWEEELIEQQGFGCMAELLLKLNRFDPIINEVPFILRYDLKQGASKMRVARTVSQTLNMLFGYAILRKYRRRRSGK